MGQLALGLVGAGVGFFVGGGPTGAMIGWAIGSMAGSLLFAQKAEGPRLNDTKVRGADYGVMRTILYGTCRIGGVGMGQGSTDKGPNEFTEIEENAGGKGGPEQVNFRYDLSFFNEICEGPIKGVGKRWANGRLLTNIGAQAGDPVWPYTLYLGTNTQMPDPTMEIIYGVGEVNPMRGVAYEAVTELHMEDYSNARPNVEYEAYTNSGGIPWRVSTFDADVDNPAQFIHGVTYTGNIITVGQYRSADIRYYDRQFLVDGTVVGSPFNTSVGAITGRVLNLQVGVVDDGVVRFYVKNQPAGDLIGNPFGGSTVDFSGAFRVGIYSNDYLYGSGTGDYTGIARWVATGGTPTGTFDNSYVFGVSGSFAVSNVKMGTSNDAFIYAIFRSTPMQFYKFDSLLNLVTNYTMPVGLDTDTHFYVYNDMLVMNTATSPTDHFITVYNINGGAFDFVGEVPKESGPLIGLGGGLVISADGVFSLIPPPAPVILGDIVADLLRRAGLNSWQWDVSDLTQVVRGFVVASQMTVHNAIDLMRKAFFFDVTEYDGKIVCRNRGHSPTENIPDGDLCAHTPGTDPPEPLEVTRVPEAELPRTVFINFYNVDSDYQPGSQYWRRTVTLSQSDVTLDLPIVFTPSEALQRAQWHMHFAWLERDRFVFFVSEAWVKLRPTNVVTVRGVGLRLTSVTEMPTGIIKCEGVRAFAGAFTGSTITEPIGGEQPGEGGGGQPPQNPPGAKADTGLILIDGPWITEADNPNTLRAAIYKDGAGAWSGASLVQSLDNGTTYNSVASTSSSSIVGIVPAVLGNFFGGNTVDESNVIRVQLTNILATLTSTTDAGLLNAQNLIAIGTTSGWEFLQYRTATLVSAGVYDLTGLLRGRFGTEWMTGLHAADDVFVLISTTVLVPFTSAYIGLSLKYKAVTFGTAIADATAIDFTNHAVSLKPWAPVLLGGGRNSAGDLIINWIPRRRGSGGWPDGVDLPATEIPEAYLLQFATDNTFATVVRQPGSATATYTYTAAMQTTDFGSPQASINWRVAQAGAAGYGYYAKAVS